MLIRLSGNSFLFAVALFFGCAASVLGENKVDDTALPQSSPYDFSVAVTTKNNSHPFYGKGGALGFSINGVQGRTLVLVRGKAYLFNIDTGPMHDFYLSTDSVGWGTAPLTTGVGGNFTYKGILTFKPSAETPDLVYYACRNHKLMGGEIHIVNPGEEGKVTLNEPRAAASAVLATQPAPDKNEVSQRLNFVNTYISNSAAAKRITASSNAEAKSKYKAAQDRLAEALSAFDSNSLQKSKSKFDEAMALMNEAAKLVPSDSMQKLAKTKFEESLKGVTDMEASFKQNREENPGAGSKARSTLDSEKLKKMVEKAQSLAGEGKYEDANKLLSEAMNYISAALNNLLSNKTMSYEMKFTSPAQEYEYELERFSSLEKSFPLAVELKHPPQASLNLMESYVNKGKEKRDQASADAKLKNFAAALENIKKGTEQLETALKLLGVN
jgi:hypothetical protein